MTKDAQREYREGFIDKSFAVAHYQAMAEAAVSNDVAAYERSLGPIITETHTELARESVMADVERFVEWLAEFTFERNRVSSDWATRCPGRLQLADPAEVLHAARLAADRGDAQTCLEAMRELHQRHMASKLDDVERLAGRMAEGEA